MNYQEIITYRSQLEQEIIRLGADFESIGSVDCIVVVNSPESIHGLELADDHWRTDNLNVLRTLENWAKLPDGAGWEYAWSQVYDSDWSEQTESNSAIVVWGNCDVCI